MKIVRAAVHGDKLKALVSNPKLPSEDAPRVQAAIQRYDAWIKRLESAKGDAQALLAEIVAALNDYKRYIELDFIFDAENDFLYRQKGQLKLDNTVLEEFLPYLFDPRLCPGLSRLPNLICGPQSSFAGLSFGSPFTPLDKGGVFLKTKDQDFSVSSTHTMVITDEPKLHATYSATFCVAHFASEVKTNLDKTMFQEASQTAAELKRAVPGSRYILLCEFLDMTPITTKLTSIDEVIVLRKAKRLASNIRAEFSTAAGRRGTRAAYVAYLDKYSLNQACFERLLWHLNDCFPEKEADAEDVVLGRGYF